MLKLKFLFENYNLAKEALENWDYDRETADDMLTRFRISSNAVYPFAAGGKIRYLRIAPTSEKLGSNLAGELEFIEYLANRGYPAARPVKSHGGAYLLTLNTQWGDYFASVFEEAPGIPLEDCDLTDELVFGYGKALGQLHRLSRDFIPKVKKWTHDDALAWIDRTLRDYSAPDQAKTELDDTARLLSGLPKTRLRYGLVHYDFEPDNVFYDEASRKYGVIDFEDGMYHWYALDIEQALDSLGDELDGKGFESAKTAFLNGYRTESPLTEEDENNLPLMRRFCNLFAYARLIRCVDKRFDGEPRYFDGEPEWMTQLRQRLDRRINELESGFRENG